MHAEPHSDKTSVASPEPQAEEADEEPDANDTSGENDQLAEITLQIAEFHRRAARYEENIRQLHSRIESLQQDQVRGLLKPVFERLAALHSLAQESSDTASDPGASEEYAYFATKVEEIFALFDIDSVEARPGTRFDARLHHAARVVSAEESDLDGTVQRVIRQGFAPAGSERVLLPARVSVYRYERGETEQPPQDTSHGTASPLRPGPDQLNPVPSHDASTFQSAPTRNETQ